MNSHDFNYIRKLVYDHGAIVLDEGKEYLVESRLLPLVREQRLNSLEQLIELLRYQPANGLQKQVFEAMITGETSFFRDYHPFEGLWKHVIPDLIARRAVERCLTVWSAACSTGQEPYSIAILLREHFPDLAGWDVRVVASDISGEQLGRARLGRYNQGELNRGLPAPLLVKYFDQDRHGWQVKEEVRRQVDFRQINLATPWPPLPRMDVVFLRNVMIYFDVETKKRVLRQTREVLRPDGYLVLGGAETTLNLDDAFKRVWFDKAGYYQIG